MPAPVLYDYDAALIDIRLVQGDDFEMVVDVEGDRSADDFDAACRPARSTSGGATFTTAVGSYNAGDDSTPVSITMANTDTDDLDAGRYLWDLQWTEAGGDIRTIARGGLTVVGDVTT